MGSEGGHSGSYRCVFPFAEDNNPVSVSGIYLSHHTKYQLYLELFSPSLSSES